MTRIGPTNMPHNFKNPERGSVLETPGGTNYYARSEPEKPKMSSVDSGKPSRSALTTLDKAVIGLVTMSVMGLCGWALNENISNGREIAGIKADNRNAERRADTIDRRLDNIDLKLDRLLDRKP